MGIRDNVRRDIARGTIAQTFAAAGRYDRAIEIARDISTDSLRINTLGEIFQIFAQVGDYNNVLESAQSLPKSSERAAALIRLTQALAQAGHYDRAFEISNLIEFTSRKIMAQGMIAQTYAKKGHYDQAYEVVRTINDVRYSIPILENLVEILVQTERQDIVDVLCEETMATASQLIDARERASMLEKTVNLLALAGSSDRAITLAHKIEYADKRADALQNIAKVFSKAGYSEQLLNLIQQSWVEAVAGENLLKLLPLIGGLLISNPELSVALTKAFTWVDNSLKGWHRDITG